MALRQIRVIKPSLTHFRLATICVDIAYKFPVLLLSLTKREFKLHTLDDINLAQRQIKSHCTNVGNNYSRRRDFIGFLYLLKIRRWHRRWRQFQIKRGYAMHYENTIFLWGMVLIVLIKHPKNQFQEQLEVPEFVCCPLLVD